MWAESPGRAARPEAASSVAPVVVHYRDSLRPCLGTAIAPRPRARLRQALLDLAGGLGVARGDPVAVLLAEAARIVLGQSVAVALAVGRAHERGHDLEIPVTDVRGLAPEV